MAVHMEGLDDLSFLSAYKATYKDNVLVGGDTVRVFAEVHSGKSYYGAWLTVGQGTGETRLKFENVHEVMGLYEMLGNAIKIFDLNIVDTPARSFLESRKHTEGNTP